ncbi:XdhC family protein [Ruegeria sp. HKCCA6837]|uniref:XdhC family protein n=1 Tax=Ruegeria sp. HKCCA6837 TaxID=2682989 RepID=UPI00148802D9|nr:XdhC family protein [Ruegeria sp. HKCCA6837]
MAGFDIFDTIEQLRQQGDAFCVATVLRTADATSAKAGGKAVVTRDGRILGHLGGACVQRVVRASAQEALTGGFPKMIRVKPSDKVVAMTDPDGVETFKSGCPSGGTVDLLIEPYQHAPRLIIFGESPIAHALAEHAALIGLRVCLPEGSESEVDFTSFDPENLSALGVEPRDFAVVASQGKGDGAALKAALETPARRVSMVASRRKAEVLCDRLEAQGLSSAQTKRLKSPAGLDIHAIDPHEIALSILAEIILWRNSYNSEETSHEEKMA